MISTTYASKLLNAAFGYEDQVTVPTNVFLGLCSTAPSSSGSVTTEPTADSYQRKKVGGTAGPKLFGPASGGIITNKEEIQMPTAKESWGQINYWFISESATGNAILWGTVVNSETGSTGITIPEKTVAVFYQGDLKASIDVSLD